MQTALNEHSWTDDQLSMHDMAARLSWRMLHDGITQLAHGNPRPDLIVAPEVAVPVWKEGALRDLVRRLGIPVVAGKDFEQEPHSNKVRNAALVVVPAGWPEGAFKGPTRVFRVGKTYPAHEEHEHFLKLGLELRPDRTCWLFDAAGFGRFAVCICFDLMDIDRLAMYRGQIQHLLVVSYNRDLSTFSSLADTASKVLACNVVIVNTGHYGGSIVITPYRESYKRVRYRCDGPNLFAAQTVALPVRELIRWQHREKPEADQFKELPAGYSYADDVKVPIPLEGPIVEKL